MGILFRDPPPQLRRNIQALNAVVERCLAKMEVDSRIELSLGEKNSVTSNGSLLKYA